MSGRTILIVAGVGVGAFVLLKLLAPKPNPYAGYQPGTIGSSSILSVGGLLQAGQGIANIINSHSSSSSSSAAVYQQGESFEGYANGLFGPGTA